MQRHGGCKKCAHFAFSNLLLFDSHPFPSLSLLPLSRTACSLQPDALRLAGIPLSVHGTRASGAGSGVSKLGGGGSSGSSSSSSSSSDSSSGEFGAGGLRDAEAEYAANTEFHSLVPIPTDSSTQAGGFAGTPPPVEPCRAVRLSCPPCLSDCLSV